MRTIDADELMRRINHALHNVAAPNSQIFYGWLEATIDQLAGNKIPELDEIQAHNAALELKLGDVLKENEKLRKENMMLDCVRQTVEVIFGRSFDMLANKKHNYGERSAGNDIQQAT